MGGVGEEVFVPVAVSRKREACLGNDAWDEFLRAQSTDFGSVTAVFQQGSRPATGGFPGSRRLRRNLVLHKDVDCAGTRDNVVVMSLCTSRWYFACGFGRAVTRWPRWRDRVAARRGRLSSPSLCRHESRLWSCRGDFAHPGIPLIPNAIRIAELFFPADIPCGHIKLIGLKPLGGMRTSSAEMLCQSSARKSALSDFGCRARRDRPPAVPEQQAEDAIAAGRFPRSTR